MNAEIEWSDLYQTHNFVLCMEVIASSQKALLVKGKLWHSAHRTVISGKGGRLLDIQTHSPEYLAEQSVTTGMIFDLLDETETSPLYLLPVAVSGSPEFHTVGLVLAPDSAGSCRFRRVGMFDNSFLRDYRTLRDDGYLRLYAWARHGLETTTLELV
jgi:hypothetical protein